MSIEPVAPDARCAEHPSRPAHDHCPRCGRPRCQVDVAAYAGAGCAICSSTTSFRPPGDLEVVVRSGLGAMPVALVGGWISTQYVYDHIFSWVLPGLVGLTASMAAGAVAGRRDRKARRLALAVAMLAGVLSAGLGFHLLPGGRQSALRPLNVVGWPYVASVLGAAAWPVLFGTPRRESSG